jgi:hypothetical protein
MLLDALSETCGGQIVFVKVKGAVRPHWTLPVSLAIFISSSSCDQSLHERLRACVRRDMSFEVREREDTTMRRTFSAMALTLRSGSVEVRIECLIAGSASGGVGQVFNLAESIESSNWHDRNVKLDRHRLHLCQ